MSFRCEGRLFIGMLSKATRIRDLEDVFEPYGRMTRCEIKYGAEMCYGFVDFEDRRDAEDALRYENGRDICGSRINVEWAKGNPNRGPRRGCGCDEDYRRNRPDHFDWDSFGDRYRDSRGRLRSRRYRSPSPRRRRRSRSRDRKRSRSHSKSRDRRSRSHSRSRDRRSRPHSRSRDRRSRSHSRSRDRRSRSHSKSRDRRSRSHSRSRDRRSRSCSRSRDRRRSYRSRSKSENRKRNRSKSSSQSPRSKSLSKSLTPASKSQNISPEQESDMDTSIWLFGCSIIHFAESASHSREGGTSLGLDRYGVHLRWYGKQELMTWKDLEPVLIEKIQNFSKMPDYILIHLGSNDVVTSKSIELIYNIKATYLRLKTLLPKTKLIFSEILQRCYWHGALNQKLIEKSRIRINQAVRSFLIQEGGIVIRHPSITNKESALYCFDGTHLSVQGNAVFLSNIQGALETFLTSSISTFPPTTK